MKLYREAYLVEHSEGLPLSGHDTVPLSDPSSQRLEPLNLPEIATDQDLDAKVAHSVTDSSAGTHFESATEETALRFEFRNLPSQPDILLRSLGGGVATVDFDNDLWCDLYFPQGQETRNAKNGSVTHDQLIRNLRGTSNSNVSDVAGINDTEFSHGIAAGDFNNDGFVDYYVCNFGRDSLLINNGDGTFQSPDVPSLLSERNWSTSASFVDLDLDGDLDLYVAR